MRSSLLASQYRDGRSGVRAIWVLCQDAVGCRCTGRSGNRSVRKVTPQLKRLAKGIPVALRLVQVNLDLTTQFRTSEYSNYCNGTRAGVRHDATRDRNTMVLTGINSTKMRQAFPIRFPLYGLNDFPLADLPDPDIQIKSHRA